MTESEKETEYAGDIFGNYNEPCDKHCTKVVTEEKNMTLKDSKENLLTFQTMSVKGQLTMASEIVRDFKILWDSKPTEKEFKKYMKGIVLFPEIIYYMVKKEMK